MPFLDCVYNPHFWSLFDSCSECGHKFARGERVWKRLRLREASPRVVAYLCEECYKRKFIDV